MIITTLFSLTLVSASSGPTPSKLHVLPCEFGEAYQFAAVECQIELQNIGNTPIRISEMSAARPNDALVGPDSLVVPANGIAHLTAKVKLENEEGMSRFQFRFSTDEPGQKTRFAEARGFVQGILEQNSPLIDFGMVNLDDLEDRGETKTLVLASQALLDFKVTGVLNAPDYVDVVIGDDGRSVSASLKPNAPLGPRQTDFLKLSVNAKQQSQVWVKLKSDVRGDVVPSANPFALGLMRTDINNEFAVRLVSRSGKTFSVGPIEVERISATTKVEACVPESVECKLLKITISNDQPTGQIGGVVRVTLPDSKQVLPIFIWGMLLNPEVEVVDLAKEMEKKEKDAVESTSTDSPSVNIKSALRLAVRDVNVPLPPGTGPLIKWSATNEQLVYGYAIYRADREAGPFVRVSEKTIQTQSTDGSGSKYQWRDNSATSGETYWYYIGLFNRDGSKQQLSTPQKVIAK